MNVEETLYKLKYAGNPEGIINELLLLHSAEIKLKRWEKRLSNEIDTFINREV